MEHEIHGSSERSEGGREAKQVKVATRVARMEISMPKVLRATQAHQALEGCAEALRSDDCGSLYLKSFRSEKISCFWSHSWHGGPWMKIMTLLVHYNGRAAVLFSLCFSLISMVLFSLGILPGIVRAPRSPDWKWSSWSLISGFVVAVVVLLLWRPREPVFLDRICINKNNMEEKKASIFSLGGILKRSEKMMVLWDPTWSTRLWCLFELSAFLKSRGSSEAKLLIRPTFLGPCSMILFSGICFVMLPVTTISFNPSWWPFGSLLPALGALLFLFIGGYVMVGALRAYFRSLETLQERLQNISFDDCRCACCDLGHRLEGVDLLCDREIVKECVSIWFGSPEAFEDCIRSELLAAVTWRLKQDVFTRHWSLSVTIPVFWGFLDLAASFAIIHEYEEALSFIIEGLVLWLLCGPILLDFMTWLAFRYCRRASSIRREICTNLSLLLVASGGFLVILVSYILCQGFLNERIWYATAFFGGPWCIIAVLQFLYKVSHRSHRSNSFSLRSS